MKKSNNIKVENERPPSLILVPRGVLPDVYLDVDMSTFSYCHTETFFFHSKTESYFAYCSASCFSHFVLGCHPMTI